MTLPNDELAGLANVEVRAIDVPAAATTFSGATPACSAIASCSGRYP